MRRKNAGSASAAAIHQSNSCRDLRGSCPLTAPARECRLEPSRAQFLRRKFGSPCDAALSSLLAIHLRDAVPFLLRQSRSHFLISFLASKQQKRELRARRERD